jgi:hypothetical protein
VRRDRSDEVLGLRGEYARLVMTKEKSAMNLTVSDTTGTAK